MNTFTLEEKDLIESYLFEAFSELQNIAEVQGPSRNDDWVVEVFDLMLQTDRLKGLI